MREIKFRAWDLVTKLMIEKPYLHLVNGSSFFLAVNGSTPRSDLEFELMQYTGLKDKNGKEIYEGDIVTAHNGAIEGVVKYQAPSFIIQLPKRKSWGCFILAPSENQFQEVIGNIYENKELLK